MCLYDDSMFFHSANIECKTESVASLVHGVDECLQEVVHLLAGRPALLDGRVEHVLDLLVSPVPPSGQQQHEPPSYFEYI